MPEEVEVEEVEEEVEEDVAGVPAAQLQQQRWPRSSKCDQLDSVPDRSFA